MCCFAMLRFARLCYTYQCHLLSYAMLYAMLGLELCLRGCRGTLALGLSRNPCPRARPRNPKSEEGFPAFAQSYSKEVKTSKETPNWETLEMKKQRLISKTALAHAPSSINIKLGSQFSISRDITTGISRDMSNFPEQYYCKV